MGQITEFYDGKFLCEGSIDTLIKCEPFLVTTNYVVISSERKRELKSCMAVLNRNHLY